MQVATLFVLAIPIACISWTVTHEEVSREFRDWCAAKNESLPRLWQRKFFFALMCEYCLSHYVTIVILAITKYKLIYDGWRGYLVAGFALVWVANLYMGIFGRLRLDIKHQKREIAVVEKKLEAQSRPAVPASRKSERTG